MKLILLCILILPVMAGAQTCSCAQNFKWLKTTFEKNDAGFQYAIDQKGLAAYQKHTELITKRVGTITGQQECVAAMTDWLRFFRKAHFGITIKQPTQQDTKANPITVKWDSIGLSETELKTQLDKLDKPGFEGIWFSAPYTIGITRVNDEYIGYILNAPNSAWKKGQVKMRIKNKMPGDQEVTYYMGDYSATTVSSPTLAGNNYLRFGSFILRRQYPVYPDDAQIRDDIQLMSIRTPMIRVVSPTTILLRIPSFEGGQKHAIDSLLTAYHDKITSTENLIIDIRNNGGGNDNSYDKIIPYLYTNPIRVVALELLSTPLNNTRMAKYLEYPDLPAKDRVEITAALARLNSNYGKFVNLDDSTVFLTRQDTIYQFPKKIGIVVNENNGSTAEQFLLAAKQSKKVKLFGTTTMGVLDISNMHFVDFPCKDLTLGYCLSKSLRIPDMAIDNKGIQPDYYIDKGINPYGWINYVRQILEAE